MSAQSWCRCCTSMRSLRDFEKLQYRLKTTTTCWSWARTPPPNGTRCFLSWVRWQKTKRPDRWKNLLPKALQRNRWKNRQKNLPLEHEAASASKAGRQAKKRSRKSPLQARNSHKRRRCFVAGRKNNRNQLGGRNSKSQNIAVIIVSVRYSIGEKSIQLYMMVNLKRITCLHRSSPCSGSKRAIMSTSFL